MEDLSTFTIPENERATTKFKNFNKVIADICLHGKSRRGRTIYAGKIINNNYLQDLIQPFLKC